MNSDPLSSFLTPPTKKRKLMSVIPSPPRLSELMAAFGAKRLPMSASRMESDDRELRPAKKKFSYAESDVSDATESPKSGTFEASYESSKAAITADDSAESEDEDEVQSGDIIHVAPRSNSTRELPKRSTRAQVSYASPKRTIKKKSLSRRQKIKSAKLNSDITKSARAAKPQPETERSKVRADIAEHTKPKRNAFLLANQEYFLPLLPETSYIDKLQRVRDMADDVESPVVPYTLLPSQPKGILATMKPYQLEGLSFLVYMYKNGMSAILGDEMGLGKTLQALSLFQYLKETQPTKGEIRPFLVVCPMSVLSSWMNEVKKWTPNLKAIRFHGAKIERQKLKDECRHAGKAAKIDIIVTTYETFAAEQGWFKRAFVWRYCVLDEGHKIKNSKADISHALQGLTAEYRLLLTGTPLQNNLTEMWSLLRWLYPEVFTIDTADNFKRAFDLTRGKVSTNFMDDARRLLELVMLRRMKSSPSVNLGLPPKEEILLYVPLTPMQRFWYTRLLTKADNNMLDELFKGSKTKEMQSLKQESEEDSHSLALLEKATDAIDSTTLPAHADDVWADSKEIIEQAIQNEQQVDTKGQAWQKLMNLIMQLRKVCSHPYILPHAAPEPYYLGEHIKTASGKFIVLDKLVEELVENQGKKILIFSGFTKTLDLCEDLLLLRNGNVASKPAFRYLRLDGSTSRARRNLGIRMFNDAQSEFKVMLISTRAGGLGINLASASNVVFMDEDWNPQITLQAEARAHRIGQTQKVTVYKLCTQGTVEEQMMGRIRKKLYLSTKITEGMRNMHSEPEQSKKRKRGESNNDFDEEEGPQLDTTSLQSLIRRGAQTLSRPEVDVTEMLSWDWETTVQKCKDHPLDARVAEDTNVDAEAEQNWLNSMEKVECAVFEGKKHQKEIEKAAKESIDFTRADRRVGKNTTVLIGGFAINKESLNCADWEAVPTMAGKDPRLAEPKREKKAAVQNQEFCQHCWDGGEVVLCSSCPRSYHYKCLDVDFRRKAKGGIQFYCPQHECVECQGKTGNTGGLTYRCRWCTNGYCDDCLDWDSVRLVGETLPEYEMLGYGAMQNAWYIECPACVKHWETNPKEEKSVLEEKERIEKKYQAFLANGAALETSALIDMTTDTTPATMSEVGTPLESDFLGSAGKMKKLS